MMTNRVKPSNRSFRLGFWIMAALAIIFYSSLHFIDIAGAGQTYDEQVDVGITACYVATSDWAACPEDPTQTRLPYYIHATIQSLVGPGEMIDYYISFAFGLATILLLTGFVYKEFGKNPALILLFLLTTSLHFIGSTRILLTNSNIIFTFFTALTLISSFYFVKTPSNKHLVAVSIFFGLSVSSHILGAFTGIFLLLYYVFSRVKFTPKHLLIVPISFLAFIATSPFYLIDSRLVDLVQFVLFEDWQALWWRYFGMGPYPSWWYAILVFIVKISPWFAVAFFTTPFFLSTKQIKEKQNTIFLFSVYAFIIIYLLLKTTAFGYDAPHHNTHVFAWGYVLVAFTLGAIFDQLKKHSQRILAIIAFVLLMGIQLFHINQFFPHLLFYGAQYGERFVGDIYGPGVFAFQGMDEVNEQFQRIYQQDEKILFFTGSIFHAPTGIFFDKWDGEQQVEYAFDTIYYRLHTFPFDYEVYKTHLRDNCTKMWSYPLPLGYEGYAIYDCR